MSLTSRRIVLHRYPIGIPQAGDFELLESSVPDLSNDEVLVETQFLSMDPAPRLRMDGAAKFPPPLSLGQVVIGRGAGTVRASRFDGLIAGDAVAGELGWQDYAVVPGSQLRKVDQRSAPLQVSLGMLGPSGITAWFLTQEAAKVRCGDTVVVTGAAGSVGSVAVQLAHLAGARVVGIVGSTRQARFVLEDLGAAAVVDYRSIQLDTDLAAACPNGANVFLDSVGGALHNAVMGRIADHARIVAFGYISTYNHPGNGSADYGNIYQVIRRRAELRGFLISDYAARFGEAIRQLAADFAAGKIKNFEHCVEGLDQAPSAFVALFSGDPIGKQLVRVRALSTKVS